MSPEVLILRAELAAKEHARKAAETRWAREKAQSHWRGKATKARMVKITPARRREIARKAAAVRWRKEKGDRQ